MRGVSVLVWGKEGFGKGSIGEEVFEPRLNG